MKIDTIPHAAALDMATFERGFRPVPVALPGSIDADGRNYNACIQTIASLGARIETSAELPYESRVILNCGTIQADATAFRIGAGRYELLFDTLLCDQVIAEQLVRSHTLSKQQEPLAQLQTSVR